MTRQQVKVLLDILKDIDHRPAIKRVFLDAYGYELVGVVTDGYMLVAYPLGNADERKELVGKSIGAYELECWYKLADNKSDLANDVERLVADTNQDRGVYPEWKKVIPKEVKITPVIRVNPIYMARMCKIFNEPGIKLEFYGEDCPLVVRVEDKGGIGMIMPLKAQ